MAFHVPINGLGDPVLASITVTAPRSIGGTTLAVSNGAPFGAQFPIFITAVRGVIPLAIFEVTGVSGNNLTLTAGAVDGSTDVALIIGDFIQARDNAGLFKELQVAELADAAAIATLNGDITTIDATLATLGTAATHPATDFVSSTLTAAHVIVGNASNVAASVAMSGGATISNAGVVTLANPSSSTLGGVQSAAAVSHQWINSISTGGVPALSQPAFSDISGTASTGQIPDLSATYSVVAGNSSLVTVGTITTGTWAATTIAIAHGGTGATSASAALTALGAAPTASPTFTGTVTFAGSSTIDSSGFGFIEKATFLLAQGVNLTAATFPAGPGVFASDAGKVWKWKLRAGTNPAGGAGGFSFTINKNGTSIFASPVAIAANTTTLQTGNTFSSTAVAEGDEFSITTSSVGTGVQNVTLIVYFLVKNG